MERRSRGIATGGPLGSTIPPSPSSDGGGVGGGGTATPASASASVAVAVGTAAAPAPAEPIDRRRTAPGDDKTRRKRTMTNTTRRPIGNHGLHIVTPLNGLRGLTVSRSRFMFRFLIIVTVMTTLASFFLFFTAVQYESMNKGTSSSSSSTNPGRLGNFGSFGIGKNPKVSSQPPAVSYPPPRPIPEKKNWRAPGETILREAGYRAKPRSLGYYFGDSTSESFLGVQRLDPHMQRRLTFVSTLDFTTRDAKEQAHLWNSDDYSEGMRDSLESDHCRAQYPWQLASFPSCNILHESDLTDLRAPSKRDVRVKIVAHGYWRDVWLYMDSLRTKYAIKTLRYEHDWEDRNYDRHRRDAVAMERLTSSANVVDIYSFCGNSGIFEYAPGGDIEGMILDTSDPWNDTERLIVGFQVAAGLSDVHDAFRLGVAAIAHTDITTSQFVHIDGLYKLNDFNRCRFIAWNNVTNRPCGFLVGNNPGNFRAPEEYAYESESEMVDIYSMGNVFFSVLTKTWPFDGEKEKDVYKKVMAGERPVISQKIRDSDSPADKAMLQAIDMCWRHRPEDRPSAREVRDFLGRALKQLGVETS